MSTPEAMLAGLLVLALLVLVFIIGVYAGWAL